MHLRNSNGDPNWVFLSRWGLSSLSSNPPWPRPRKTGHWNTIHTKRLRPKPSEPDPCPNNTHTITHKTSHEPRTLHPSSIASKNQWGRNCRLWWTWWPIQTYKCKDLLRYFLYYEGGFLSCETQFYTWDNSSDWKSYLAYRGTYFPSPVLYWQSNTDFDIL